MAGGWWLVLPSLAAVALGAPGAAREGGEVGGEVALLRRWQGLIAAGLDEMREADLDPSGAPCRGRGLRAWAREHCGGGGDDFLRCKVFVRQDVRRFGDFR
eukprot:CAMPEP_0179295666 /NCGR_PEP_ID=MMETSP0797-20121207/44540_1 /TAXON_ID=47934 /ORGANISM="Dinophysis acuminata, Strain DAEP01" /LENGTH=100 /DNA_ID=CAMNT_0021004919 /DNA_START=8 /DNA_END=307 /DNA_ORIENTATION=-